MKAADSTRFLVILRVLEKITYQTQRCATRYLAHVFT